MSAIDSRRLQRAVWLGVQPVAPGRYLVTGGWELLCKAHHPLKAKKK